MAKSFTFRLTAESAEQVIGTMKQVAATSAEADAALQTLIRSSPQLASVADRVTQAMEKQAGALQQAGGAAGAAGGGARAISSLSASLGEASGGFASFGALLGAGGTFGLGAGFAFGMVQRIEEGIKALIESVPEAGSQFTQIAAKLQTATGSVDTARTVFAQLLTLSRQTGVSIEESAATFTRFRIAAQDVGATNDQVVQVIGGIQKAGIIAGLTTAELTNGTRQLAQGLAAGRLQGQDLRAVLEDMPNLGAKLAAALGTSIGNLRKMGEEGKLTSDTVFRGLLQATADVNGQFEKMPVSIDRAKASLDTAATQFAAELDRAFGVSQKLVASLLAAASALDGVRKVAHDLTTDQKGFVAETPAPQLRQQLQGYDATLAEARSAGVAADDPGLAIILRQRQLVYDQLKKLDADAERQRADAAQHAAQTLRARLEKETADILNLDPRRKIEQEYAQRKDTIAQYLFATGDQGEADRMSALAQKAYETAIAGLHKAKAAQVDTSGALADSLQKLRDHAQASAKAVMDALDPSARALETYRQRLKDIEAAEALYASSGGVLGFDTVEAIRLRTAAQKEYADAVDRTTTSGQKLGGAFNEFFSKAASGFENAIVQGKGFSAILQGLEQDIARLVLRSAVLDPLAGILKPAVSGFFGSLFGGGSGKINNAFADGGVMTPRGSIPLNKYAGGGIADSPQFAIFGEGRMPEAYVPLPDGRSIPVSLRGGQGGTVIHHSLTVHVNGSNASPAQIGQIVSLASAKANQDLIREVSRGGPTAKQFGRRGRNG